MAIDIAPYQTIGGNSIYSLTPFYQGYTLYVGYTSNSNPYYGDKFYENISVIVPSSLNGTSLLTVTSMWFSLATKEVSGVSD